MFKTLLQGAAVTLTLAASPALACPDWTAAPNFGQVELSAGFHPDPHVVQVTAGGDQNLSSCLGQGYLGFVSVAPDFDLYWSGGSDRLIIAVESNIDTVMLINDPNGNWLFNDDYRGLDAGIEIRNPAEGLYDIWVGSFSPDNTAPARLLITELDY